MRKIQGKKVRFIAIERKYRSTAYQAVAPLDNKLNIYVTGQHYEPEDPDRKGFLTMGEITGDDEVKPLARQLKFRPLISETTVIPIIHNKEYDCTFNEKNEPNNQQDFWHACFIISQDYVAKSKGKQSPKHIFYLDDKEVEAKVFNTNADDVYEAQKLIRESATLDEYKDIVMLLNLSVRDFNVDHKPLSSERLKEVLLRQAEKEPETVKFAFTQRGKDFLFLAKLRNLNILAHRKDGYYDGDVPLAVDAEKMVDYIADPMNDTDVAKWGRLLKEAEAEELV